MRLHFLIFVFFILMRGLYAQSRLAEAPIFQTERRIALVVGMDDYAKIRPLKNPSNDADDMSFILEQKLGFKVKKIVNKTYKEVNIEYQDFLNNIKPSDIVLIYFSGHGIGYLGDNYLLPIDVSINCFDVNHSLSLKQLSKDVQNRKAGKCFFIIDACRSISSNLIFCTNKQSFQSKGLVIPYNQITNTVIVFATQAEHTAEDNQLGRNGLFTQELIKLIGKADLTFGEIISETTSSVVEISKKQGFYQEPTIYGGVGTNYIFLKSGERFKKEKQLITQVDKIEDTYSHELKMGITLLKENRFEEAFKYISQSAEKNEVYGEFLIGSMYSDGLGVKKDQKTAKIWLTKAAEKGMPKAQSALGTIHYLEGNYQEAKVLFERAAKQNDTLALVSLGDMYFFGLGIEKDIGKSYEYFMRTAENSALSQARLGHIYLNGLAGFKKDFKKAKEYYQKASDGKNPFGDYGLAVMYYYGLGTVSKNIEKAKELYIKAGLSGIKEGQYMAGTILYNEKELDLAIKWFDMAKDNDYPGATYMLGVIYYDKWVKSGLIKKLQDENLELLETAINYFEKAEISGDKNAESMLRKLRQLGLY